MYSRLRFLLPVLALVAIVASLAVAAPIAVVAAGSSEVGAATAAKKRAKPKPKRVAARKRVRPKPKPAPTLGERAAKLALTAVGVPYSWGGTSMSGFDCSGLVYWAYRRLGITVPHNSYALWAAGRPVPRRSMEPGDVLVFSGLGHVGLYIGRGRMVHAPRSGMDVQVVRLASSHYGDRLVGARRFVRS